MSDHTNFQYLYLWWFIGLTMVATVISLSLISSPVKIPNIQYIDKLEHMLAYAVLMAWYTQLYVTRASRIIWAIIFCVMGITLEFLQEMGGFRMFEYNDMLANITGVFLGWWISSRLTPGWLARVDRAIQR